VLPWLGAGAAFGLVARRAGAAEAPGPIMAELSAYMARAAAAPLPPEAAEAEAARHHLLGTLAAMICSRGRTTSSSPTGTIRIRRS